MGLTEDLHHLNIDDTLVRRIAEKARETLVCWDCGTPIVMRPDGAEKPCGHTGAAVIPRAEYVRLKAPRIPEPPDFDQIAKQLLAEQGIHEDIGGQLSIAAALRQVWNDRGAADLETVTAAAIEEGCQPDGPFVSMFTSKLRRLDR